jgi:hypothetical protein
MFLFIWRHDHVTLTSQLAKQHGSKLADYENHGLK